jgi:hypothetical protein
MKEPGILLQLQLLLPLSSPYICPTLRHSKTLLDPSALISVGIIYLPNYFKMIKRQNSQHTTAGQVYTVKGKKR